MSLTAQFGSGPDRQLFTIRKLCGGKDGYDAMPHISMRVDLKELALSIEAKGLGETSIDGIQLTVLMFNPNATVQVFPSGKMHVDATGQQDAMAACECIYRLL